MCACAVSKSQKDGPLPSGWALCTDLPERACNNCGMTVAHSKGNSNLGSLCVLDKEDEEEEQEEQAEQEAQEAQEAQDTQEEQKEREEPRRPIISRITGNTCYRYGNCCYFYCYTTSTREAAWVQRLRPYLPCQHPKIREDAWAWDPREHRNIQLQVAGTLRLEASGDAQKLGGRFPPFDSSPRMLGDHFLPAH